MKKLSMVVAIVLAASLTSRAQTLSEPVAAAGVTETEYQVLAAYITDTLFDKKGENGIKQQMIVVLNKTQSDQEDWIHLDNSRPFSWEKTSRYLRKECKALQVSTLGSFREANAHPALLSQALVLPVGYGLADHAQVLGVFKNGGGWTDYYRKYPNSHGFLTVSRIGFSADGAQALLYLSEHCGGLCGAGTYVVMEKVGSSWKVMKIVHSWES